MPVLSVFLIVLDLFLGRFTSTVLWDLRKNRKRLVWFYFNPLSSTKRTSKQINIFLRSLYCFEEEKVLSLSVAVEQTGPAGPEQRGSRDKQSAGALLGRMSV